MTCKHESKSVAKMAGRHCIRGNRKRWRVADGRGRLATFENIVGQILKIVAKIVARCCKTSSRLQLEPESADTDAIVISSSRRPGEKIFEKSNFLVNYVAKFPACIVATPVAALQIWRPTWGVVMLLATRSQQGCTYPNPEEINIQSLI